MDNRLMAEDIHELIDAVEFYAERTLEEDFNNHLDWVARIRSYADGEPKHVIEENFLMVKYKSERHPALMTVEEYYRDTESMPEHKIIGRKSFKITEGEK